MESRNFHSCWGFFLPPEMSIPSSQCWADCQFSTNFKLGVLYKLAQLPLPGVRWGGGGCAPRASLGRRLGGMASVPHLGHKQPHWGATWGQIGAVRDLRCSAASSLAQSCFNYVTAPMEENLLNCLKGACNSGYSFAILAPSLSVGRLVMEMSFQCCI